MENNQKIGFSIILGAILFILFSILLSESGYPEYMMKDVGYVDRFMRLYFVAFFKDDNCYRDGAECYLIAIPTKWTIFVGICIAAYGLTVYKNITRFPPWKKQD